MKRSGPQIENLYKVTHSTKTFFHSESFTTNIIIITITASIIIIIIISSQCDNHQDQLDKLGVALRNACRDDELDLVKKQTTNILQKIKANIDC